MKKAIIISLSVNALLILGIFSLLYYFVIPYQPFRNLEIGNIESAMACEGSGNNPIYPLSGDMKEALVEVLQDVKLHRVSKEEPMQVTVDGEISRFVIELQNGKTIEFGAYSDWCFLINGKYYTAKQPTPLQALSEIHNDALPADHRYKQD